MICPICGGSEDAPSSVHDHRANFATGIDRERILERVGVYVDTLDRSCSQCGGTYTVRDHEPHQCP